MTAIKLAFVFLLSALLTGCATEKWAEMDDNKCRSWGASGSDYTKCRAFLDKKRWDDLSNGLAMIGQGAGQAATAARPPAPPISEPCIDCKVIYQN